MSIELLALIGLIIGVMLYALLVRRRALLRNIGASMARQLAASNEIALGRLRDAAQRRSAGSASKAQRQAAGVGVERRSGDDRRVFIDRRRGRGRRTGGDRRRGSQPT